MMSLKISMFFHQQILKQDYIVYYDIKTAELKLAKLKK